MIKNVNGENTYTIRLACGNDLSALAIKLEIELQLNPCRLSEKKKRILRVAIFHVCTSKGRNGVVFFSTSHTNCAIGGTK